MMRHLGFLGGVLLVFLLLENLGVASTFPTGLSGSDVGDIIKRIGAGSSLRLLRTAEPYPFWPGVKFGVELGFIPRSDLNELGNGNGTIPSFNLVPRFYIAKGLFADLEIILTYFPGSIVNTINTSGVIFKWSFQSEQDNYFSGAAFLGLTSITAFDGQYTGNNLEIGGLVSKDYVRLRPYMGAGIISAKGKIMNSFTSGENTGSAMNIHFFFGLEYETPVNLSFQLDFINFSPAIAMLVSKHY